MRWSGLFHSGLFAALLMSPPVAGAADDDDSIDFNRDILPILSDKCFACHGPDAATRKADLRLDLQDSLFGKRDEPLIVRGDAAQSDLYQRVLSDDPDLQMPPPSSKKQLTAAQKELIRQWIDQGAKWATHWAYVLPTKAELPAVTLPGFTRNEIDHFTLNRIRKGGLEPTAQADDVTLIRRLSFDLLGLPPTPEDVAAFVSSTDPKKYEQLVERLLSSTHFGERMAVYWLDVVRYADSNGYHSDEPRQVAPYRDYVIESFNENKPYDRFIIEQLAGDLLPDAEATEQVASGFNMLLQTTSEGGAQAKEYLAKYMADRVRNTSQIFLGSTMGCCECHDHKYDPFTTSDFYSFGAFFADLQERAVGNPATYPVITETEAPKIADFDRQIVESRTTLNTPTPELITAQEQWEAASIDALKTSARFGEWQMLGPFPAADFEAAWTADVGVESLEKIDPAAAIAGKKWQKADKLADGTLFPLSGDNSFWYFARTVTALTSAELKLSLGSDDAIAVWLNGKPIHSNKTQRAVAADQDQVTVPLAAGASQLLIKIVNATGPAGFYFNAKRTDLPDNVVAALLAAGDQRTDQQKNELVAYFRSVAPELKPVRDQIASLEKQKTDYVNSLPHTLMTKTTAPRPIRLLPRGNWLDDSGPELQPAIPGFLGTLSAEGRANRLDLAHWIVDRNNPLTARTFVNRLWKLYFGQGLATPLDDLGRQGTLPTHPQLLDWLAVEFMESGWDVKHLVRKIVASGTYRQASDVTPEKRKQDPYNQLYARQSRFRIDAEFVRDNALAVSGLLVESVGGRSVYPYQPAGYWRHMNFPAREWPGDNGESLYRRGLYTWWQRMFLHPSMVAFDAPSREECTVERPRSNIPQQALVLLNDPTYVEAARAFAARIIREGGATPDERLSRAFQLALSRNVTDREAGVLKSVLNRQLENFGTDKASAEQFLSVGKSPRPVDFDAVELAAWTSVARVILNLHEVITRS